MLRFKFWPKPDALTVFLSPVFFRSILALNLARKCLFPIVNCWFLTECLAQRQ